MKKVCIILLTIALSGVPLITKAPVLSLELRISRFSLIVKEVQKEIALQTRIALLAEAIKIEESGRDYFSRGDSKEYGAYQFLNSTWIFYCIKFYGKVLEPTPENQNKVAKDKLKYLIIEKGYSDAQIISFWNSGSPIWKGKVGVNSLGVGYNVPKHVKKVLSTIEKLKSEKYGKV